MFQYCSPNSEIRNGYFISEEIKSVWNIQLNMLAKLIEVCEKYELKLYASSGTLLGAIRHKGYIPWDDDIDVEMMREDYDKLLKIAPNEFKSPYFFQCPYTEKGYYRGHSQIRYDGTTAILPKDLQIGRKFHQGIFIDIFVLDKVPSENKIFERNVKYRKMINDYLWMRHYPKNRIHLFLYFKNMIMLGKKAFWSDEKLYNDFERNLKKEDINYSHIVAPLAYDPHKKYLYMNINWYSGIKKVPFEQLEIPIPIGYNDILTTMYGNYMKPVQAPTAHGEIIFDVNKSYKEYLCKEQPLCTYILRIILYKMKIIKKIY